MVTLDLLFVPFGQFECGATGFSPVDYQERKKERKMEGAERMLDVLLCYVREFLIPYIWAPTEQKSKCCWPLSLKRQEICQIPKEQEDKGAVKMSDN